MLQFKQMVKAIKILSWNVNGIRAVERKDILPGFLTKYDPDFFFIQEIKGNITNFSTYLNDPPDYQVYYNSAEKKGYSGTGVWIKKKMLNSNLLIDFKFDKGIHAKHHDEEGRVAKVFFKYLHKKEGPKKYCLMGIYFPNGGKSEQAWEDKLVFYNDFLKEVNRLQKSGVECIWSGDVNCAHNEIDLARPKENDGAIGFHPRERAWMNQVIEAGWVDVWRKINPDTTNVYSWWSMVTRARNKNIGWRIDYFFCYQTFFKNVIKVDYLNQEFGSDHCPIIMEFNP